MKYPKITSLTVNEDRIDLFEGRTPSHQKCVVVYFAGPEGWGVTMDIHPEKLDDFIANEDFQKEFVAVAKDKLGIAA